MISVEQAKKLILENISSLAISEIKLNNSFGCVLGKDIISTVNLPPFNQSAMDGYAFSFSDLSQNKKIKIIGEIPAGKYFTKKISKGECVRIFTGAPVPKETDTVVMQEKVSVEDGYLVINDSLLKKGSNIRLAGSHITKGSVAMPKNTFISPGGIGYLAAMGISKLKAISKPRVSVIVTGSELKKPGEKLNQGQIYESNSFALDAALKSIGIETKALIHLIDNEKELTKALKKCITNSDLVLVTGGISVGDYDFTGSAFSKLGVKNIFYKIKQKPGKPLFFGKSGKTAIFGLPGNPAAVLSCFYEYVYPSIKLMQGYDKPFVEKLILPLANDCQKKSGLSAFLKGKILNNKVLLLDGQESYILSSFAVANCLIYLSEESESLKAGELVEVHKLPGFE